MNKPHPSSSEHVYLLYPENGIKAFEHEASHKSDQISWSSFQLIIAIISIGVVGGLMLGLFYSLLLGLAQGLKLGLLHGLAGGSLWSFIWYMKWSEDQ